MIELPQPPFVVRALAVGPLAFPDERRRQRDPFGFQEEAVHKPSAPVRLVFEPLARVRAVVVEPDVRAHRAAGVAHVRDDLAVVAQ